MAKGKFKGKAKELGINKFPYEEFNEEGLLTYREYEGGKWYITTRDAEGRIIKWEAYNGDYIIKRYCEATGRVIYRETRQRGRGITRENIGYTEEGNPYLEGRRW